MRMPPLPADSIHARACKLKCEKILTRPLGLVAPIREREVLDFSELLDTCPELTKKERKVLTLIYLHGYTSVDIARIVHTTKQNINQVKMRALKKLRRYQ